MFKLLARSFTASIDNKKEIYYLLELLAHKYMVVDTHAHEFHVCTAIDQES